MDKCPKCNDQGWVHPTYGDGKPNYHMVVRCRCWLEKNGTQYAPESADYWATRSRA